MRVLALGPQYGHASTIAAKLQQTIHAATGLHPVIVFEPTATTARMLAHHAAQPTGTRRPSLCVPAMKQCGSRRSPLTPFQGLA